MDMVAVGPEDKGIAARPAQHHAGGEWGGARRSSRSTRRPGPGCGSAASCRPGWNWQALLDVRSESCRPLCGVNRPQQRCSDSSNPSPCDRPRGVDTGDRQLAVDGRPSGAVRAVLAWDALRVSSPGRLRPCANTECRLFLIDRSKPNTARWCSMAICGNRMKARRHYRRARTSGSPPN